MSQAHPVPRHSDFRARVDAIGTERQPVLVIDNFLTHAETLVDFAATHAQFNSADANYPGVRAPAPGAYLQAFRAHLAELIYETFGLMAKDIVGAQADFSMVVTPPANLRPLQRIPHYDSNKSSELAAVHFLCGAEQGGTDFYRHRSTGFEFVDQDRRATYKQAVDRDVAEKGMPPLAYMQGDTQLFERIASYPAAFNRLLVYRCTSLHSGNIASDFSFDPNPRTGRLTLNTFIFCR